jgi:hypothetical protein
LLTASREPGIGSDAEQRDRDERDRSCVDRIAIIALEQGLLIAEYLPPQCCRSALFPCLGRELDLVCTGEKRFERFEYHA